MTTTSTTDILVAGGNFAGLALALALSRQSGGDFRITVVSPDFPPLDTAAPTAIRASALSRGSLNLLDNLGVWQALAPHTQAVTSIELTDSAFTDAIRPTRLSYDLTTCVEEPEGLFVTDGTETGPATTTDATNALARMVIVENHLLAAALHAAARSAPGITLVAASTIEAFTADPLAITARLTSGQTIAARLLVAADGGRSNLREFAGIRTVGHPYEQSGIITIVDPELPHDGRAIQHFLPAGPFALLPMTGNRICVTWTESAAETRRILALPPADFRVEVERRFGNRLGTLKAIAPPQSWPLRLAIAGDLIAPRFALVGDAAHTIHPLAGQGINLGFRDVAALTECVIDNARLGLDFGSPDTLQRYQRWRRFDNLASAAGFDAINRVFADTSTIARSARGAALAVVDRLPGLKSWLTDEAAGESGDVPALLRPRLS